MIDLSLRYGSSEFLLPFDPERFQVLDVKVSKRPLSDSEIGCRLDSPIGSQEIEGLVGPGDTALIVVPDATRMSASGQIVNLLVRRLIAAGIEPYDIRVIVATGIHRKATESEKRHVLTPFIYQRLKVLDHDPRNLLELVKVGETASGIPVELNRQLLQHDHIFLVGGISFHYFAGFTGGRKLICPGLASSRTISETHRLAFDCETLSRRRGVGTGLLEGNSVHEAFVEAAKFVKSPFLINTIVNGSGECIDIYCGDMIRSHLAACSAYEADRTIEVDSKRGLVIASCGGSPYDINLIQAHKALDAASKACHEGGTLVLLAECPEGLGRGDMVNWFDAANSREMAMRLCEKYRVNGQTAWSIREKTERFEIFLISSLDESLIRAMGFKKAVMSDVMRFGKSSSGSGYILPKAATVNVKERSRPI
jgi:nickel-dependent lactate racemase